MQAGVRRSVPLSLSPNSVSPDAMYMETTYGTGCEGHLIPVDSTGGYCPPCIALRTHWTARGPA